MVVILIRFASTESRKELRTPQSYQTIFVNVMVSHWSLNHLLAFRPNFHPPGNLHLTLKLGSRLSRGRCGVVHTASVSLCNSSPEISSFFVPPLVAKISYSDKHEDLAHELFYYEEMESLQGVAVPRCFGLFHTGAAEGLYHVLEELEEPKMPAREPSWGDIDDDYEEPVVEEDFCGPVSILLVEQLGEHLPIGKPLPTGTQYVICLLFSDGWCSR